MDLITPHARARMQQRGIRPEALEALLDFGRAIPAGRGRDLVFFDRKARRKLVEQHPEAAAEAARITKCYAIVGSDGALVTVGHRYRRIPR